MTNKIVDSGALCEDKVKGLADYFMDSVSRAAIQIQSGDIISYAHSCSEPQTGPDDGFKVKQSRPSQRQVGGNDRSRHGGLRRRTISDAMPRLKCPSALRRSNVRSRFCSLNQIIGE